MNNKLPIRLPHFFLPTFYARGRCRFCQVPLREIDLLFVGARRDNSGNPCFAYEYQCSSCRHCETVVDATRRFTRPDWWNELVAWNNAVPPVEQMAADSRLARRTLPRIGPIVLDSSMLESAWIRGGYRGDVGPVMLIFEGTEKNSTFGVLRLGSEGRVRLFDFGDRYCLLQLDLGRFAALAEGGKFPLDGRDWIKMSVREIEEIVRDRVCELMPDDDDPPPRPVRKPRRAKGNAPASKPPRRTPCGDVTAGGDERPEFYARNVCVLNCTPGNFEHANGEPASVIALGHLRDGEINPLAISMRDSRLLAVKLLVAIATCDDHFAQHLLDQHFPADENGDFRWPDEPYQLF